MGRPGQKNDKVFHQENTLWMPEGKICSLDPVQKGANVGFVSWRRSGKTFLYAQTAG